MAKARLSAMFGFAKAQLGMATLEADMEECEVCNGIGQIEPLEEYQ